MSSPKWLWWWHQEWNQEKWLKEEVNFYFIEDTRKQNRKKWMQSEIRKDSRCRPGIPTKGGGGWTGFLETFPVKGKSTRKKGTKWPLFLKPGIRPGRQMTSWNDPPGNGQKLQVTAKFQVDSGTVWGGSLRIASCSLATSAAWHSLSFCAKCNAKKCIWSC